MNAKTRTTTATTARMANIAVVSSIFAAALFALPAPASQMAPARVADLAPVVQIVPTLTLLRARIAPGAPENFGVLVEDPFLIDALSIVLPAGAAGLEAGGNASNGWRAS